MLILNWRSEDKWNPLYTLYLQNTLKKKNNLSDLTDVNEALKNLMLVGDVETHWHDGRYLPFFNSLKNNLYNKVNTILKTIEDTLNTMKDISKDMKEELKKIKLEMYNIIFHMFIDFKNKLKEKINDFYSKLKEKYRLLNKDIQQTYGDMINRYEDENDKIYDHYKKNKDELDNYFKKMQDDIDDITIPKLVKLNPLKKDCPYMLRLDRNYRNIAVKFNLPYGDWEWHGGCNRYCSNQPACIELIIKNNNETLWTYTHRAFQNQNNKVCNWSEYKREGQTMTSPFPSAVFKNLQKNDLFLVTYKPSKEDNQNCPEKGSAMILFS